MDFTLHPVKTVWRGMEEELGLHEPWVRTKCEEKAEITFMGMGFQMDNVIYVLFSIIELPNVSIEEALERAREHRTCPEPIAFDQMDFTAEQCAQVVVRGTIGNKTINYCGRYGLLLAALRRFGDDFTRELARLTPNADGMANQLAKQSE